MNYANKQQLINEINKTAKLFIEEFHSVPGTLKDVLIDGVDRTPAQMISYQLNWLNPGTIRSLPVKHQYYLHRVINGINLVTYIRSFIKTIKIYPYKN